MGLNDSIQDITELYKGIIMWVAVYNIIDILTDNIKLYCFLSYFKQNKKNSLELFTFTPLKPLLGLILTI